jgi:hypothetical protein
VARLTTRPVTNAALTSFGVRESRSRSARSQKTPSSCRWLSRLTHRKPELLGHPVASHSVAAQGYQSRGKFSPFQVGYLVQHGHGGSRCASGQILVAVGRVSRTVAQCHQEAQRCLTHRSSGAPTARRARHQAQGLRPILRLLSSTPRCWLPLTSNVRQHIRLPFGIRVLRMHCNTKPDSGQFGELSSQILVRAGRSRPVQTRAATGRKHATNHSAHVLRRSVRKEVAAPQREEPARLVGRAEPLGSKRKRQKARIG